MSRIIRSLPPPLFAALAALVFAMILSPLVVGQDFAVQPGALDPWFGLAAQFVGPSTLVFGLVLIARLIYPPWFDPEPNTHRAKVLCMAVAIVGGIILAIVGVAPGIGHPGTAGRVAGGLLCACLATFGRDFIVRSRDGIAERKAP